MDAILLVLFIAFIIVKQYMYIFRELKALRIFLSIESKSFMKKVCNHKWQTFHLLVIVASAALLIILKNQNHLLEEENTKLCMTIVSIFSLDILVEMILAKDLQNIYYNEHSFFAKDKCYRFKQIKGYRNKKMLQRIELEIFTGEKMLITKEQFKGLIELLEEHKPNYKIKRIG